MSTEHDPMDGASHKASRTASALDELMSGAKALQSVQEQAALEALRLPNPRLDHPGDDHFMLRANGDGTFVAVDAHGNEVKHSHARAAAKAAER